jgi:hypothetical protein
VNSFMTQMISKTFSWLFHSFFYFG